MVAAMTRQQAGVSALTEEQRHLAVSALRHYRTACSQSGTAFADNIDSTIIALLATAPPEQAQRDAYGDLIPPERSVKMTYGKPTKEQVEKFERTAKEMIEGAAAQPQAASAGALREELKQVIGSRLGVCDLRFYNVLLDDILALLAAHDQKVRAEVLEEAAIALASVIGSATLVRAQEAIRALGDKRSASSTR